MATATKPAKTKKSKSRKSKRTKNFNPGGTPGKLHRELGIPVGQKIPKARLDTAARSPDREVRNDAIRAKTMAKWKKGGRKK